jgi:hypothetical protein
LDRSHKRGSFPVILFIFIAAAGGDKKKNFCGDTAAKSFALCTPENAFVKEPGHWFIYELIGQE